MNLIFLMGARQGMVYMSNRNLSTTCNACHMCSITISNSSCGRSIPHWDGIVAPGTVSFAMPRWKSTGELLRSSCLMLVLLLRQLGLSGSGLIHMCKAEAKAFCQRLETCCAKTVLDMQRSTRFQEFTDSAIGLVGCRLWK